MLSSQRVGSLPPSLRFLVDAQLPVALARFLSAQGCQAEHVRDVDLESATDSIIWTYAQQHQAAIVTKDDDFRRRQLQAGVSMPQIVWVTVGNVTNRSLLLRLGPQLPKLIWLLQLGTPMVQVI